MTRQLSGFITFVKEVGPDCMSTDRIKHREMLAGREMSREFHGILNDC